jgi:hypothetical protein
VDVFIAAYVKRDPSAIGLLQIDQIRTGVNCKNRIGGADQNGEADGD